MSSPQTLQHKLATIKGQAREVEKELWVPLRAKGIELGKTYPVASTATVIFLVLSFIPIFTFGAFVAFTTLTAFIGATIFISSVVLGSIFLASIFFVPTILFTLTMTAVSIVSLVSSFMAYRFYIHLRTSPDLGAALTALKNDLFSLLSNEMALVQSTGLRVSLPMGISVGVTPMRGFKEETVDLEGYLRSTAERMHENEQKVGEMLGEVKQEQEQFNHQ